VKRAVVAADVRPFFRGLHFVRVAVRPSLTLGKKVAELIRFLAGEPDRVSLAYQFFVSRLIHPF
jgi:hypothetical protein